MTAIDAGVFKGNKKLEKITLGKNVSKMPSRSFSGSAALTTLIANGRIISIGSKAFYGDKKWSMVRIKSEKLNKIGASAFYGCKKRKTLTLDRV